VLGVADVAEEHGMSRSTTHRYLTTLVALGYLEQTPAGKYRLASHAADVGLAALNAMPIRRGSREHLESLRDETGLTVSLGALDGTQVLYLDRVRGRLAGQREIDMGILGLRVGWRLPAHRTALGKLLLAHTPDEQLAKLVRRLDLRHSGPGAIATKRALREELERIRAADLAVSDRELDEHLVAAAAPVRDPRGNVTAAVAVEAHSRAFTTERLAAKVAPLLVSTAALLSAAPGGQLS
jgi:DNA-binding IclR family transcriptional regulator